MKSAPPPPSLQDPPLQDPPLQDPPLQDPPLQDPPPGPGGLTPEVSREPANPWTTGLVAEVRTRRAQRPRQGRQALVSSSLSLVAVSLLAFVGYLALISNVEHSRSQRIAYADLRTELSALTAPTGQTDLDGKLLPLGTPLGYLSAPGLGLEREVFFEGTTGKVLAKGPGHRRSTPLPGQPGVSTLYGRAAAYSGPFSGLEDVDRQSIFTVTTAQGEHTYEVIGTRREGDPVPPPPGPGESRLTLVTATGLPFIPDDVIYVDAKLTSPVVPAAPRQLRQAGLLPAEAAMAGDSSGWPKIYLLMQGLAVSGLAMAWASRRWGSKQAWVAGFPLVGLFVVLASRDLVLLLPNLL